ncbi:MAG: DUF1905 domain-containing protein [Chloroflexi bacterium]|nr:DUF1905 domain-containing protein [Chloroflexota bacterium]OJW05327.1 MAG: hypothetical protein BGO39_33505 [Chloroflexi bacterium 54-19]
MKFQTTIEQSGKTATGLVVPEQVVERLGAGKKPAVSVTINGYTYRSTIASMGGRFMLPLSAENRAGAKVAAGETVEVEVELDAAPREVAVPPDFAAALDQDPEAKQFFERLAYSHKLRHVLAIDQAKSPETRQRRIEGAIKMLHEGKK